MFVSPTTSIEDYNFTKNDTPAQVQCQPQNSLWAFGWMFIPVFEVILNSFFIFVTYRSKRKLRHNFVYAYVINVFTGNLLLGTVTVYNLFNFAFVFERYWGSPDPFKVDHSSEGHQKLQLWWAFQRAFCVSLYLTNNANVSALIYGIRDSAYFVGRNVTVSKKNSDKMDTLRKRRSKALAIIAFAWVFPLGFAILGVFSNCIEHCLCVYANYNPSVNYCQTNTYTECSRIWMPLTHKFLLGIVITWSIEVAFHIFMLIGAVKRAKQVMQPRASKVTDSPIGSVSEPKCQSITSPSALYSVTNQEDRFSFDQQNYKNKKKVNPKQKPRHFNTTLKLLFAITITFFVTSLPLMVVIFIDVISVEYVILRYSVTVVLAISFFYPLLVPFILVYYMPTLRNATNNLIFSFKCCTRTMVKTRTNSVKTAR